MLYYCEWKRGNMAWQVGINVSCQRPTSVITIHRGNSLSSNQFRLPPFLWENTVEVDLISLSPVQLYDSFTLCLGIAKHWCVVHFNICRSHVYTSAFVHNSMSWNKVWYHFLSFEHALLVTPLIYKMRTLYSFLLLKSIINNVNDHP